MKARFVIAASLGLLLALVLSGAAAYQKGAVKLLALASGDIRRLRQSCIN